MITTLFAVAVPFAIVMTVILILIRIDVLTPGPLNGFIGFLIVVSWLALALSGGILLAGILVG